MADNREQSLDADILQCMQDILRIRQSIVNSKSGQVIAEPEIDIHPVATISAKEEVQEPPLTVEAAVITAEEPATAAAGQQVSKVTVVPQIVATPMSQPIPAVATSSEIVQADNPFAVTREEVAALFNVEDEHAEVPLPPDDGSRSATAVEMPLPVEEIPIAEEIETIVPGIAAPEYLANGEAELDTIVKEAEEWMAKVAPEEMQDTLPDLSEPDVATVAEAVVVPEKQFDEVVSNLQGEQLIAPVDEEPPTAEDEDDVKLQIIRGMKEESERGEEERGGVPRFDLGESSLGGTLESRRNAAATRKGPGRRRDEGREASIERTEEKSLEPEIKVEEPKVEEHIAGVEVVQESGRATVFQRKPEVVIPRLEMAQDTRRLERQKRILAQIVARDIEILCGQGKRQRARVVWRGGVLSRRHR